MNVAFPLRIQARLRISFAYGLLAVVPILSACGVGSSEPPSSAHEVLMRVSDTMANVESFTFEGEITSDLRRDGQHTVTTTYIVGVRGSGGSTSLRETHSVVADPPLPEDRLPGNLDWVAVDGVVLSRNTNQANGGWREWAFSLSGRPPNAPSVGRLDDFAVASWSDDVALGDTPVHLITGVWPSDSDGAPPVVEFYVAQDSFHLLRVVTRIDRSQTSGEPALQETHVITTESRLHDFDEPVEIEFPEVFEHAQFATYVFEFEGNIDEEAVGEMAVDRLGEMGAAGIVRSFSDQRLSIRLFDRTFPPDRVRATLDGILGVQLTLVDYLPPRGPHYVPTALPDPTPTPDR